MGDTLMRPILEDPVGLPKLILAEPMFFFSVLFE